MTADQIGAAIVIVALMAGWLIWHHQPDWLIDDEPAPIDITGPGVILADLIAEAICEGRLIIGEAVYVEHRRHPCGVDVPVRVWGESAAAEVMAEEFEAYLSGREHPRR